MEAGGVMEGGFEIGMLGRGWGWGWGCRWRGNGKLEWRNAVWCSFVSRSVRQHEDGNEGACAGLDFFCWFDSHDFLSQESARGDLLHGGVEKENGGKSTRKNHEGPLTCRAMPSI